jgi:hypothetical protein
LPNIHHTTKAADYEHGRECFWENNMLTYNEASHMHAIQLHDGIVFQLLGEIQFYTKPKQSRRCIYEKRFCLLDYFLLPGKRTFHLVALEGAMLSIPSIAFCARFRST